jgi:hypothetical protein
MAVAAADVSATGVVAAHATVADAVAAEDAAVVHDAVAAEDAAAVDVVPEDAAVAAARGPAAGYRGKTSSSSWQRRSQLELGWRGQRASSQWCLESDG